MIIAATSPSLAPGGPVAGAFGCHWHGSVALAIASHTELRPGLEPVFAQSEAVLAWRLVFRPCFRQGEKCRPQMFARAAAGEALAVTERMENPLTGYPGPIEADGVSLALGALDPGFSAGAVDHQADSTLSEVSRPALAITLLEV